MELLVGFIFLCTLAFMGTCLYAGVMLIYNKLKNEGLMRFLESAFYILICIAVVFCLSMKVSDMLLGPSFSNSHEVKTI